MESMRVRLDSGRDWLPDPVPGGIGGALRAVVAGFERRRYCAYARVWRAQSDLDDDGDGDEEDQGAALLVRRPGRRVHVVGGDPLADRIRALLGTGEDVGSWRLHRMPETITLLEVAEPLLGHRTYAILTREGFRTVEELAATPDVALLGLRNIGPKTLDAIHTAVTAHTGAGIADRDRRRAYITHRLDPARQARDTQFLDALAASAVPIEAVEAILTALAGEPLPPADPHVGQLLRAGGEPELASIYERSRIPATTTTTSPDP